MTDDAVPSDLWTNEQADHYDDPDDPMFAPELLAATSGFLSELAGDGSALEFAIGTGRVAVPLRERGVPVHGIEYSPEMAAKLREKTDAIPVVIGDMATARLDRRFSLVYLVFNTIGNLYTQDAQVECFRNAARHLDPGGHFVVEVGVPSLRSSRRDTTRCRSTSRRGTSDSTSTTSSPSGPSPTTTSGRPMDASGIAPITFVSCGRRSSI
ncbi:class I SAM-dependent DNA methyltransferase [Microbacterium resistens]|uniref:class I SAM-dependent DNA methyltransferase n=1 Tax=Microbacterium resistens TaxID=156977 RepID=UPI003671EC48